MKYCIKLGNETYPISEEEMPKVVEAMSTKSIVILKSGVFHGSYINAIVKDIHAEKGWSYGYIPNGSDGLSRKSYVTEIPKTIGEIINKKLLKS